MSEVKLKKLESEFLTIVKKIDNTNKDLVVLLNKIETEFMFDPFNIDNDKDKDKDVQKLWEKVSKARNFEVY